MIEGQFNFGQRHLVQEPEVLQGAGHSVRTFEYKLGNVMLVGHCLSSDEEVVELLNGVAFNGEEEQLTYLSGSYTTIISSPTRTTVYSDLAGQFPVYFTRQEDRVHYGMQLESVAKYASGMPDTIGLAIEISHAHALDQSRTIYEGVRRLPAAHRLDFLHDSVQVEPYEFFAPTNIPVAETALRVREALLTSMSGRLALGQTVTGDFSGGLDSTSLAFLALGQFPPTTQFHAFHSYFPESPAGDLSYARTFAKLDNRIALHLVEFSKNQISFDPNEPVWPTDKQLPEVRATGSEIHLNGTGSDALFNAAPAYLYDMWHKEGIRGIGSLLPAIIAQARLAKASPIDYLRKVLTKPRIPYAEVVEDAAKLLQQGEQPQETQLLGVAGPALSILSESVRRKLGASMHAEGVAHADIGRADHMAISELWASGRAASEMREQAAQQGVAMHFPFLDHQVIRASLQIPAYRRHNPRQFKALLRQALEGVVPDEVLQRQSKGTYSSEAFADIRQNAANFRNSLGGNSLLARLGIISVSAAQRAITDAELGLKPAPIATLVKSAVVEQQLQSRYKAPKNVKPTRLEPMTIGATYNMPTFPVSVAPYVRAIEDHAGLALYNLQTNELRALHHAAAAVVKTLHGQGGPEAVYEAVAQTLAPELRDHTKVLSADILTTLVERGFLQPESQQPFSINTSQAPPNAHASEVFFAEKIGLEAGVKTGDYFAMIGGIRRAHKVLAGATLDTITRNLETTKRHFPWSSEARVERLLHAGHMIGKYYFRRLACQELSLAVVLAELQRNRRVDWAIGAAADPRGIHTWPEVDGKPIRTVYDDVVVGKYTKLGVW